MAQEYYDVQTVANILGITPAQVNQLRERGELRGFRDGATWKFPIEHVHEVARLRRERVADKPTEESSGAEEVLASELELGQSEASASGTVLTPNGGRAKGDTDLRLAAAAREEGGELELVDAEPGEVHAPVVAEAHEEPADELALVDDEFTLSSDSGVALAAGEPPANGSGGQAIKLSEEEEVIGAAGGSDVKLGHDSGISLVDPHDSGLSLEDEISLGEAIEPKPGADETVAIGEDEMLTIAAEEALPADQLRPDSEFLLRPEDDLSLEDSETASQVIALEPEGLGDESPTVVSPEAEFAPTFEEFGPITGEAPEVTGVPAAGLAPTAEMVPVPGAVLPEAPFGTLAMVGLAASLVVLSLAGIMSFELLRNMWSWGGPTPLSSWLMDTIAGLFG